MSWELGPHLTQCGLHHGLYLPIKWHLDPSSRLATTDMGQKLGAVPFGGRELCPHPTQCGRCRGLPTCQVSSSSIQPFGHNRPTPTFYPERQDDSLIAGQTVV